MTRPAYLAIIALAGWSLYHAAGYISDRVRISQEREAQCAGYDREDRKPCLIVRVRHE